MSGVLWPLEDRAGAARDILNTAIKHEQFFSGLLWDADSQLYYARARWYEPVSGKFLSEDPIGFEGGDVNVSRYSGNDPVNNVDRSGLSCHSELMASLPSNRSFPSLTPLPNPPQNTQYGMIGYLTPEEFAKLPVTGTINPWRLRTSQDTASWSFKPPFSNSNIGEAADLLRQGDILPSKFGSVQIVEKDGMVFSVDNRRILTFRSAGMDIQYGKTNWDALTSCTLGKSLTGVSPEFNRRGRCA